MPPKKRGRPRKSTDEAPPPKRRGRPRKSSPTAATSTTNTPNRSALSVKSNPPATSSAQRAKKPGRPAKRTSRNVAEEEEEDDDEDELQELPSTVRATVAASSSATGGKGKGKARGESRGNKGRGGNDDTAAEGTGKAKEKGGKRSAADAELDGSAAAQPPRKKFAHLKPRTRHISQSVITTKWRPAPPAVQHSARALFVAAKRPVVEAAGRAGRSAAAGVVGEAYDKRRAEAEVTLASVLRKLEKQVPRIPFPPMRGGGVGLEGVFDLERVVERNRALEAELTPQVYAVKLLREAVAGEEEVLEAEREALEVLEERARGAERRARERERRGAHPVVKRWRMAARKREEEEMENGVEGIRLAAASAPSEVDEVVAEEDLEADEQLAPVLEQLQGHLDSMRANREQVEGLDEVMNERVGCGEITAQYDTLVVRFYAKELLFPVVQL
ncbi:putative kinetochore protein [Neofusicoccum parvum UCRNP2]|uniref:Putative kinetochore protein n=1 Tax=Botryosphaeria parva (strain UCR-NP2) TaxID=1287680 RepID=R1EB78_BOTPV|nr:putative kinetochore protein [Neofusicoccum parvum UCRNP2]